MLRMSLQTSWELSATVKTWKSSNATLGTICDLMLIDRAGQFIPKWFWLQGNTSILYGKHSAMGLPLPPASVNSDLVKSTNVRHLGIIFAIWVLTSLLTKILSLWVKCAFLHLCGSLPRFSNLTIITPATKFLIMILCYEDIIPYHFVTTLKFLFNKHQHCCDIFMVGL